jgi:hypothetical protein
MQLDFAAFSDPLLRSDYPADASEFVLSQDIRGNMYNFYDWGGYLIWRLGPGKKVFTDGRIINERVYLLSRDINNAREDNYLGLPVWKAVFEAYHIKYAIVPFSFRSGRFCLSHTLIQDREWVPVFTSLNYFVFVKNDPENYQVINQWAMPKDYAVKYLLGELEQTIKLRPWYIPAYISAGDLYLLEKNLPEARKAYKKALDLAPFNHIAQARLYLISQFGHPAGTENRR